MLISKVSIKNYRNFQNFKIELGKFNLIFGENNIGKTNFINALEGILNPTRSFKSFKIEESDFIDIHKPIIIKIKFQSIDEDNELINILEDGIIDPEMNYSAKLKFIAKWNPEEKDIDKDCFFIKKEMSDDNGKFNFKYAYRRLFHFYSIPSMRWARKEIRMDKKSDLMNVINYYLPNFIISFSLLKKGLQEILLSLKEDLISVEFPNSVITDLDHLIKLLNQEFKIDEENKLKSLKTDREKVFAKIKEIFSNNSFEKGQIDLIDDLFNKFNEKLIIFEKRFETQRILSDLKKRFSDLNSFKNLQNDFSVIIEKIMPNIKLDLSFVSIQDNELLKKALIEIDDFPILAHGTGFQSYFVIALKLLKINSMLNRQDIKSSFIAIEEPEAHLYPHLQRQLIENLRVIQNEFESRYDIKFQFIITSHSSNILSRFEFPELILLRKNENFYTESIHFPEIRILIDDLELAEEEYKSKVGKLNKSLIRVFKGIFTFYPEAFFSRCIILGEGSTEEGAIPEYARTMNKNFDLFSISYISLEGTGNLKYYKTILKRLNIPFISIVDKDDNDVKDFLSDDEFITKEKAFEAEIISKVPCYKLLDVLISLCSDKTIENYYNIIKNELSLTNEVNNFGECINFFKEHLEYEDVLKKILKPWIIRQKGLTMGKLLGEISELEEIPEIYKEVINKAVEKTKS